LGVGIGLAWPKKLSPNTVQDDATSRRYRLMTDYAHDMVVVCDVLGNLRYLNAAATRLTGFAQEELRGRNVFTLFHPQDQDDLKTQLARVVAEGRPAEMACRVASLNGEWLGCELTAHGLPGEDWVVRDVVLQVRAVSQRAALLTTLARSEQRFRDFAASSADWLWETDVVGRFTYISPGVANVLGFEPEELLGRGQLDVLFSAEDDPVRELMISRTERQQAYRELEFWTNAKLRKDTERPHGTGMRVCLRVSGVPVFDSRQEFLGYRGAASNITASKMERDQVYRLATTDHLTGLLNSMRFKEELERAVALSRQHNTEGVVLFIDLDRFKEINDTHGHEAGDAILQGIADILRESVRATDVVARRGGDEFSIIMHNISVELASQKVQRMINAVKAFGIDYNGSRLTVTMSVGMVPYPMPDNGHLNTQTDPDMLSSAADHLLMSADLAMYKAKDMGRNRLFVDAADATSETVGSVRAQLKWLERLRHCLEHEEFELHYQTIVPAHGNVWPSGRPLAEALLRIYDEQGKVGSPALYIDAAEHYGLIQQLDLAVVKRVFQTQAALMQEGLGIDISINLSCRTLGDPAVLPRLKNLITQYAVDPARIVFEVTETMALHDPAQMRDLEDIKDFIGALRAMGFRFALDDFGTGFTSFKYLKLLDVDIVKIDGEYVKDIMQDPVDRLFVQQMAGLCKGLGITTIAEFVETKEISEVLIELGVEAGQGWLYAKPQADIRGLIEAYSGKTMVDWRDAPPLIQAANGELPHAPLKLAKANKRPKPLAAKPALAKGQA
ncbi:MAG: putative bifunctional diguanylate cyclase/phosphodiesterase, partial [Pseudomonadota bacterium]